MAVVAGSSGRTRRSRPPPLPRQNGARGQRQVDDGSVIPERDVSRMCIEVGVQWGAGF